MCGYPFHLEHILPRSRGGTADLANRALACSPCNLAKGPRTEAIDPVTRMAVQLFHPRTDRCEEQFAWADDGYTVLGLTPVGRATIAALDLNMPLRLTARRDWRELGLLP